MACSIFAHVSLDAISLGNRVANARQMAGLRQDDVAQAIGLDRSALAKIEIGARRVTALELAQIAEVVGERVEWLLEDSPPAIVSHRSVSDPGQPSAQIDRAIEQVARSVEFVAGADSAFGSLLQPLAPVVEPVGDDGIEAMASEARTTLGADPVGPLHHLAAVTGRAGVLAFPIALGADSADAASVLLPGGAVVVINSTLHTGRRRLSLAHELGHVLIADEYTVDWRVDHQPVDRRERMLDDFARAFLLPAESMAEEWREYAGPGNFRREAAVRIASRFRVDMTTLARRLRRLGIVDDAAAADIRRVRTTRADIVEFDLVVADELPSGELPREYQAAVLRLYRSEHVSAARALDLLMDTWTEDQLPTLPRRPESSIWQFVH